MSKSFSLKLVLFLVFGILAGVVFAVSGVISPISKEQTNYKLPTLTFHLIALSEGRPVFGGTFNGPKDSLVDRAELIVQFYKEGQLMTTDTLNIDGLYWHWPRVNFRAPVPDGVDCYDVIATRTFDREGNILPSVDETTELLKPGRCRV